MKSVHWKWSHGYHIGWVVSLSDSVFCGLTFKSRQKQSCLEFASCHVFSHKSMHLVNWRPNVKIVNKWMVLYVHCGWLARSMGVDPASHPKSRPTAHFFLQIVNYLFFFFLIKALGMNCSSYWTQLTLMIAHWNIIEVALNYEFVYYISKWQIISFKYWARWKERLSMLNLFCDQANMMLT